MPPEPTDEAVGLARALMSLSVVGESIARLDDTARLLDRMLTAERQSAPLVVDIRVLSRLLSRSESQVRRFVEDDQAFPQPVVLDGRPSWLYDEVRAWVLSRPRRLRSRDAAAAAISAIDRSAGRVAS